MDQLITASKAEININTRHHSPSITINNGNQNAFLSTANLDFSKYMRKSKDHCQSQWLNHLEDKPVLELISDNLSHK